MFSVLNSFSDEKVVVERERASKSYRLSSFYFGKVNIRTKSLSRQAHRTCVLPQKRYFGALANFTLCAPRIILWGARHYVVTERSHFLQSED